MVNKSSLVKKLASYSAVAAAMLAVDRNADAQIIYTPISPAYVGQDTTYQLDLNNDGIIDFEIMQHGHGTGFFNSAGTGASTSNRGERSAYILLEGEGNNLLYPLPFQYSSAINNNIADWQSRNALSFYFSSWVGQDIRNGGQTWNYGDTAYVPLQFQSSGNTYFGWIRLKLNPPANEFIITGYAYNATPGATIYAGQECDLQFPKPIIQQTDSVLSTNATYKIQWYYNNKLIAGDTLQSITTTKYGIYSITTGDTTMCYGISVPYNYLNCATFNPPIITSSGNTVCYPYSVNLTVDSIPKYYSIEWLENDSIVSTYSPYGQFYVLTGGNYKAVVYENGGCSDTSNVINLFSASILTPKISQKEDTLFSNYTSGNMWSNGDTTQYTVPSSNGLYNLCLTDSSSCTYCQNNFYYVNCDSLHFQITSNLPSICVPNPVFLSTNTKIPLNYEIEWYLNDSSYTSSSSYIITSQPGKYIAIIEEPGGCADTTQALYLKPDSILLVAPPTIMQHQDSLISNYSIGDQWLRGNIYLGDTLRFLLPTANGSYDVLCTDSLGCQHSSNAFYFVSCETYEASLQVNNPSSICYGDTTSLIATDTTNSTYMWNPFNGLSADTGSSVLSFPSVTTTYIITATATTSGCTANDSIVVSISDCHYVWPGDANEDLVVNNYDLIPIGLYYGDTGPARDTITNTWAPHIATQWDSLQTNGMNKKFVDCNGDGTINSDDTLAVSLNYGLSHPYDSPGQVFNNATNGVPLYFISDSTNYQPGSTVHTEVWVGNVTNPVPAIYGLAYDISIDASAIQPGTLSFSSDSSFIGIKNENALTLTHLGNDVETVVTGIDHTNKTGYGKIGDLYFILAYDDTTSNLVLSFTSYEAVNASGNIDTLSLSADTLSITNTATGIKNVINSSEAISLFPDPAKNQLTVTSSQLPILQIEIENVLGQTVMAETFDNNLQKQVLDVSTLPAGMYFYRVTTINSQIISGKFIKD